MKWLISGLGGRILRVVAVAVSGVLIDAGVLGGKLARLVEAAISVL